MFPALDNAVRLLSTLPGIGERSALRIAFHLLKSDRQQVAELASALTNLCDQVQFCRQCASLAQQELCELCSDPQRDASLLCVVEEPGDVYAIERTGEFKGLYHVLMGALSPLDGVGPQDLRLNELFARIESSAPAELFLATNPTLEGDATARYIQDRLRGRSLKLTRISHGIPTGAAIEYADRSALARSVRARTSLE
ncbi:MAG: recombination mediator RecR [Leptospirales bacterium]|nr:recombination mediator RecR [Leptospirales bacterium]